MTQLDTRKTRLDTQATPAEDGSTSPSSRSSQESSSVRAFEIGEVAAGRYRIVRFIASGAHGEVYEAEDLEIGGAVALKTVRPEIAFDPVVLDRLRRELQLARRVTHPNVCRLFDLGRHQPALVPGAIGPEPPVLFLTMELLTGETLSERLRRTGPMSLDEALPLVRQMAGALAAAHEAGIVHRDFKSGNVMLCEGSGAGGRGSRPSAALPRAYPQDHSEARSPLEARPATSAASPTPASRSPAPPLRAVITDFGLARTNSLFGEKSSSLTAPGDLMGTPAYMSPEQIEGGKIGPATDIYALGVVLYEMVTGKRPFTGESSMSLMLKRLREPPTSPRLYLPELDARWEAVLLRCLERDPGQRFQSALDVVHALEGSAVAPPPPSQQQRRRQRARRVAALAGVAALAVAAASTGLYWLRPAPGALQAPAAAAQQQSTRRSAALLGFKNLSGRPEAAWLSNAFAEILGMELGAGEQLRIIPGENVARMKLELELAETESLAPDTLARIGKHLGADLVLVGSYLALGEKAGGQVRLNLRVQSTSTGETLALVSASGTETGLLELVSRVGSDLRTKLGLDGLSATETGFLAAARPRNPEAARLYAEGVMRLRLFDAQTARNLLREAVAADPGFAPAHGALAAAWSALGHDAEAQDAARRALELSAGLPRQERLLVEGRYSELMGDWSKAIEVYRTLWDLHVDDLDFGLLLAEAQYAAGRPRDALATLELLRRLPAPAPEDPRIDLVEARAAGSLTDFPRQLAAAERTIAKAETRGARHLVARALLEKANALTRLGDAQQAARCDERAKRIFEEAGDRWGMARALNRMASMPYDRGDYVAARRLFEESLALSRLTGDRRSIGRQLGNLAETSANLGDLSVATKLYQEAMSINRERGSKDLLADNLWGLGRVLALQGDLTGSTLVYQECLSIAGQVGNKRYMGYAMDGLALNRLAQADLPGARQAAAEALAVWESTGQKDLSALSRLMATEIALEEGRAEEAERLARTAAADLKQMRLAKHEAWARALLGQVLRRQGRLAEAREPMERATELALQSQSPQVRLRVRIAAAALRAAASAAGPAAAELEALAAEASSLGLVALELEARLELGRLGAGTVAGRAQLEALKKEASARGFDLLARKAAEALL